MTERSGFRFIFKKTPLMLAVILVFCTLAQMADAAVAKTVRLTAGKASTIDLPKAAVDILVANPDIADVGALKSNRLYIVGKAVGDTNVLAFNESGDLIADITVRVKVDEGSLLDSLKQFFPDEDIQVKTVNRDIVLSGEVSSPAVANQVRELAQRFITEKDQTIMDLMKVSGEQQVMLKVKIMEVARANLREYGIYPRYQPDNGDNEGRFLSDIGSGLIAPTPFATGSLFFDDNGGFGPLGLTLQAMQQNGLINVLAEPNLTAITGETAGFLAGGEFPIPSGRDNQGNVIIEFKKFGVSLNFTPRVLSKDRISLLLDTEVSSLDKDRGITLESVDIPGLSVRRAQTTVEIGSGGTIMIAGLIQSRTTQGLSGLPGASDLPIFGELFKSKSFNRDESEVLIVVTPFLVKPYAKSFAEYTETPSPVSQLAAPELAEPQLGALEMKTQDHSLNKALSEETGFKQSLKVNDAITEKALLENNNPIKTPITKELAKAEKERERPRRFNTFGEDRMAGIRSSKTAPAIQAKPEAPVLQAETLQNNDASAEMTYTFIPQAKPNRQHEPIVALKTQEAIMPKNVGKESDVLRTALPPQKPLAMSRFNQKMFSALYQKHDHIFPAGAQNTTRGGYILE